MKLNLKEFLENRKPILPFNTFDAESNYWATFQGDATENLDANSIYKGTPAKKCLIAFYVEAELPKAVLLDVGCGVGRMNTFYNIGEYHGIDTTPAMIEKAKALNKNKTNAHFYVGDGKTLKPLPNNYFDFVICSTVFLHLKVGTVKAYLKEVHRILKVGGRFIVNVPQKSLGSINFLNLFKDFHVTILDCNYCGTDIVYDLQKTDGEKPK